MSIRARLALAYATALILTLALLGALVWWRMDAALQDALAATLATRASGVLTSLENAGQAGVQETDRSAPGVFVVLFAPDGTIADATSDAPAGVRPVDGSITLAGRPYLLRTQTAADGTIVVTGASLVPIQASQDALARLLVGFGAAVGAASLVGGLFLAGRALRPVDRLIDEATALGPHNLDRRLTPPARPDEVGRLTDTLNYMLDRIAAGVERQRRFVATAAHELRTPLAALRAELDLADRPDSTPGELREAVRDARGDTIRLANLAHSLLELATADEDASRVERTEVQLPELVATVARDVEPLARQRGVSVVSHAPDISFGLDRLRVERALTNMLSNAIVHGGAGGEVEIRCQVAEGAIPSATFEILDRGPGLGTDEPLLLFEPFVRGPHAAGRGSGLGLASVASAARGHGGEYGAGPRPGGGSRVWLTLPAAGYEDGSSGRPEVV